MDDPYLDTYLFPRISGVMVSIIAFGKLCSGAKTLGWEHSNGTLKNDFENLGIVLYSSEMFSGKYVLENGGRSWWFYKKALVFLCSRSEQLTRATTLPWYGGGA
jgi:hypothetical protein